MDQKLFKKKLKARVFPFLGKDLFQYPCAFLDSRFVDGILDHTIPERNSVSHSERIEMFAHTIELPTKNTKGNQISKDNSPNASLVCFNQNFLLQTIGPYIQNQTK